MFKQPPSSPQTKLFQSRAERTGRVGRMPILAVLALYFLSAALACKAANTPVITVVTNQFTDEDVSSPWVPFLAYDIETGVGLSGVTGTSSNPVLLPDSNIYLWGFRSNWLVRVSPAANQYGTAVVTLSATNTDGVPVSTTFQLTVAPVNDPPTLNPIPEQFLYVDAGLQTIPLTGISSGAADEVQELTVTATQSAPEIITNLQVAYTSASPTGTLSFGTVSNAAGSVLVTVSVNDGAASNNVTSRSFRVNVHAGNYPPVISAIADVQTPEDTMTDNTGYRVSDVESDPQSLVVTAHSSDPWLIPDEHITIIRAGQSGLIKLLPATNAFGSTLITITVTDPGGASSSTTFHYTVLPVNDPPTLDAISDMVINENAGLQTVPLTGITSGAANEAQALAVVAYAIPPGILTNVQVNYTSPAPNGQLTFGTVSNVSGSATITVMVDDGAESCNLTTRSVAVQVVPLNEPPTISPIADLVTDLGVAKQVNFTVGDLETAADNLILSVASSNPALVPEANIVFEGTGSNRLATISPVSGQSGTAIINIRVADSSGGEAQAGFVLTVRPDPLAPAISQQPQEQRIGEQGTATFSVVASGDQPLSFQWQRNGSNLDGETTATLTVSNVQTAQAGDYTVIVSNARGSSTSIVARLEVLIAPTITQLVRANSAAQLSFTTVAGQRYALEFKNSLQDANWTLFDSKAGTGEILTVEDVGARFLTRFYRVRVE